jgi:hypothetical protein
MSNGGNGALTLTGGGIVVNYNTNTTALNQFVLGSGSNSWSIGRDNASTGDLLFSGNNGSLYVRFTNSGLVGIGTSTPKAKLGVQYVYGENAQNIFAVASSTASNGSTASTLFAVDNKGHLKIGGSTPTNLSNASIISGADSLGSTTVATGVISNVYILFASPFSTAPQCFSNLQPSVTGGTSTVLVAIATTTSQIAFFASASNIGGSIISWHCLSN